MSKIVKVAQGVQDMGGLYYDLMRSGFAVKNVGGTYGETHVFLEETEEKDPSALVEEWSKKEPPSMKELIRRRDELVAEDARRQKEEEKARKKQEALEAEARAAETQEMEVVKEGPEDLATKPPSLLKRIWSKFF